MRWTDGLRLAPAVARSRILGGPPYKLLLSVTDHCTHRCRHCRTWTRSPREELRPDEIGRMLDRLPTLRWLDLTGGEIGARPDAFEVARVIAGRASGLVFLHVATNGDAPERIARIVELLGTGPGPRRVVTVSLDGDRALHDHVRGKIGAFDRAVATARVLAQMEGVDVYLGTTVTPDNVEALERTRAALREALPELGEACWHVNLMNRSGHFFRNLDVPPPATGDLLRAVDDVRRLRGAPRDAFAVVERLFADTLRRYLATGRAPVACQAVRASVHVGATGDVYPCHVQDRRLGNVRDANYDLPRLLAGATARHERARIRSTRCSGCWTPCEAYPSMLASPFETVLRSLMP